MIKRRKKTGPVAKGYQNFIVRIEPESITELQRLKKIHDISMSEIVRIALKNLIAREKQFLTIKESDTIV